MLISIRKFDETDVATKVRWVNDSSNNTYLHYDLPLCEDKTFQWFERIKNENTRFDAVILADGVPVGLVGLLCIDSKNEKAEYYIMIGEATYRGKGVALKASRLLLDYAFTERKLNKVYLYTEKENFAAQKLFERIGFEQEGLLVEDLIYCGRKVDRFYYGITATKYFATNFYYT